MEPGQIWWGVLLMCILLTCIRVWPKLWGIRGVPRSPRYNFGCPDRSKCSLSTAEIEEILAFARELVA